MAKTASHDFDVIVIGGGPAGSVMGWALAKQGVKVAVLERTLFPREKVCGDYVEPGGLRILDRIGVLSAIERHDRLRIARNRVYFGPKLVYRGPIPYYEDSASRINYGLIIPRHELDNILLEAAKDAGATVFCPAEGRALARKNGIMKVDARTGDGTISLRAPLVIGADGVESFIAKSVGLRRKNRRHIGVSQRAYVDGVDVDGGEAAVWFDEEIWPGYGWMFPMSGGRANVGVGLSSETSHRFGISVREVFQTGIERLRIRHPGCANVRLVSAPLGGVVKAYGGIDRNHFDGGLLIGDAGSFVDPMTGEGITHGMESAILALPVLMDALDRGRFESSDLARFDADFHRYFDPAMRYLEVSASLVNNHYMTDFWMRIGAHGHEEAAHDPTFARIAGSIFGGPALQPLAVAMQTWSRVARRYADGVTRAGHGDTGLLRRFFEDFATFQACWTRSKSENPDWHNAWIGDIVMSIVEVQKTIWTQANPRPAGVFRFIGAEPPATAAQSAMSSPFASPDVMSLLVSGAFDVFAAGLALLRPPELKTPATDAEPRRRWRAKM